MGERILVVDDDRMSLRLARRMNSPELPLRNRLYQLLSTIALSEFLIVTVYTMLTGGGTGHIVLMLLGTSLFPLTVAFTFRSGRLRIGPALSALLYFSLYPLTFFSSGGMYGGAPVVFAFALVYVFLATEHWERTVALSLCILVSAACYLLSCARPELLERHSVPMEHAESFLSILLVTLLLCALFAFVTQVYREENRIVQRQKAEIEELHRSQKRFFSSMSHEIRTPVNAILGFNEMTLRENVSGEVRENALNIEMAGRLLLHSVNEILDMSQLETGRMTILTKQYRTADLISDLVGIARQQARAKGLTFRVSADPALPGALIGDEVRVRQILLNLLSNAVKYTERGSVTLSIGCREETDRFWLICEVSDTGIGIRAESIPHLFTAFQRLDEQKTHAIEGTGLGLSIVRQLLDLMGGSVRVSSVYGQGSTFHIELPQQVADRAPIGELSFLRKSPGAAQTAPLTAPALQILAVDDTRMNLMVLKKLLRDTGVCLDTAQSGPEALQKTAEQNYDLIFMDHQMPEMDGVECLRRIRAQEGGLCRESKVVCLTANVGAEMEQLCRRAGFDGYLAKPVRGATLAAELARLFPDAVPEEQAPSP